MKTIRRTKIRLETHELKSVSFSRKAIFFCRGCNAETQHLPIAQMAKLLAVSEKKIFRLTDVEMIHSTETADGKIMVCADSAGKFETKNE